MAPRAILPICSALLASSWPVAAPAQDAAEAAVILSGTGQPTGRASRSLGSAVSSGINAAAAQIAATRGGSPPPERRRRTLAPAQGAQVVRASGNVLEGTGAPTYRLGSGATIQVSGTLVQDAQTSCSKNCAQDAARSRGTR